MATTKLISNPAAMVLQNPELLETILRFDSQCKKTVVSASLIAKTFSEPAFNVLWCEMHSLWPLFRLIPTLTRRSGGTYEFTGPVLNEHLDRVLYYAKRIRVLYCKEMDKEYSPTMRELMISTYMRIDKLGAFFPLRKIYIQGQMCHTMLLPLSSPNLEHIEFNSSLSRLPSSEIGVASFLHSVASQSRLLKSLAIVGHFSGVTLQVLPAFTTLKGLIIQLQNSDVPVYFLRWFASSMPSLEVLRLHISTCRFIPHESHRLGQLRSKLVPLIAFPSLETFVVECKGADFENVFGVFNAPALKSITLNILLLTHDVDAYAHKFLELHGKGLKGKVHNTYILTSDVSLSVLKSFDHLEHLRVRASQDISMPKVTDIFGPSGSRLRSLVHVRLHQPFPTNPDNCMSMAALYLIADACPNLNSLEISIYHPDKPEKQLLTKDGQERKPHNLERLVFFNLPGLWVESMALAIGMVSLLGHVFPSMAVPCYLGARFDKRDAPAWRETWWKGVEEMWIMCQTIKDRSDSK